MKKTIVCCDCCDKEKPCKEFSVDAPSYAAKRIIDLCAECREKILGRYICSLSSVTVDGVLRGVRG